MSQITVTGGCGFIGLNLTDYLLTHTDWDIVILDNLTTGSKENLEQLDTFSQDRITFIQADIRTRNQVTEALQGSTYAVNLAAHTGVIPSIEDPFKDADVNIFGLLNVLDAAVDANIDTVIQASSGAPLGEQTPPMHEQKVPRPLSPYGASKLAGEGYCSAYAGTHHLTTVALRFSNVYGPYAYHKGSVVALFIKQLLRDEPVTIYGDGNQTRDFIHARDIARAIHAALTTDLPHTFNLFQIATGEETTINRLYELIKLEMKHHGHDIPSPLHAPPRDGEIYRNYADISKAEATLGYTPSISLKDGIAETVSWFIDQQTP